MAINASEWNASTGFDHIKAVQTAAFFIRKSGGSIDKMKLIKLIYLAERLSFARRSRPMNFDDFFSMRNGPIASSALDGINGKSGSADWRPIKLTGITVSVEEEVGTDHLSKNDLAILEDTWGRFGRMSTGQLRNWTHHHCPEYEEVEGGRLSITYDEILSAVGAEDADAIARDLKRLQRELGRLPAANAA